MDNFDKFLHAQLVIDETIKFVKECKYKVISKHLVKSIHEWLDYQDLAKVTYDDGNMLITLPWEGYRHISMWFYKGKKTKEALLEELERNLHKCMKGVEMFRDN